MDNKALLSIFTSREIDSYANLFQYVALSYDSSTFILEKLYAALLSFSQPFYYDKGCLINEHGVVELDNPVERYDISSGYSVFHEMIREMGSYPACSYYQEYIPKTDLNIIKQQISEIGITGVIGNVFENLLPKSVLVTESFYSYVIEELMSDRSSVTFTNYLLLTSRNMDLSHDLIYSMENLFGHYTSVFHFKEDKHYFLYFFEDNVDSSGYECTCYNTINPCTYLKWIIAHET